MNRSAAHFLKATCSVGLLAIAAASARASGDVINFINDAVQASTRGNYMGTVVYQRGTEMEAFKVVHLYESGVEHERIATLDGAPKEMIRVGDQSTAYLPQEKLVRLRPVADRAFPSITPSQVQGLRSYFNATDLGSDRIAGYLVRGFSFTPKDAMRYTQQLWADTKSGLLLRVRILNERGELVEQVAFTDLQVGARISKHHLRSSFASRSQDWRVEVVQGQAAVVADTGWICREPPQGFVKVREGLRVLGARSPQVAHLLFSDGIATISVFIEPGAPAESLGLSQQGAVNVYRRQMQDVIVTALGQSPPGALKAIADSMVRVKQ
jgi:sigma-E factor negative regulatory protein RseB